MRASRIETRPRGGSADRKAAPSGSPRLLLAAGTLIASVLCATHAIAGLRSAFVRTPSISEREAAVTPRLRAGVTEGVASALCEVAADRLFSCKVIDEEPAASGLGDALVALAPFYRLPRMDPPVCERVFNKAVISLDWPHKDVAVEWASKPPGSTLARVYPKPALRKRIWGAGAVRCIVSAGGGAPRDCKVLHEEPTGMGFGEALVAATPSFAFSGAIRDGRPVDSFVIVPINFVLPNICF